LHSLRRLSLVDFDASFTRLRLRRVLQRAIREAMPEPEADAAASAAADALYAPHGLWQGRLHQVIMKAGNSLARDGLLLEPMAFWEQLLTVARERLGSEHPDTLVIRNNLAWAYGRAGDPHRALGELLDLLPPPGGGPGT
jgi:hypothetical protein